VKEKLLELVGEELKYALNEKRMGAVFPLSRFETAFDFRIEGGLFLFVSVEPADPRVYLIRRKMKDLARLTGPPLPFHAAVRKHLTGAMVSNVAKVPDDRVLVMELMSRSESGDPKGHYLIIQMTGRSANVFLLDAGKTIIESLRPSELTGQRPGDPYLLQSRTSSYQAAENKPEDLPVGISVSEYLDTQSQDKKKDRDFDAQAAAARRSLDQQIAKRKRLIKQLGNDLEGHGEAKKWKRYGDLLLANSSTAVVKGNQVIVKDLFADEEPEVAIDIGESESITAAAERFYKQYTKARNAAAEISARQNAIHSELEHLRRKRELLEAAIEARDESFFEFAPQNRTVRTRNKKPTAGFTGARKFLSSDGMEILVGKKAVDNDQLTFRIARSLDFWLHAADYSGSHVVVRNPNRRPDIPQKTLIESAQLAAFYSNAKTQPKAAVNYTQKKFVTKPKGSAAGLARLSRFKTILVDPQIPSGVTRKE
jgi:predicted ribosome quality control (RQC) complex YloA/Tae2 family protein